MKKQLTLALVGLIAIGGAVAAQAMGPLDAEANLGLYGKYVWRGMAVTDDPVLQPDVSFSAAGVSFSIWGNMDTSDVNGQEWKFSELDYTLAYGVALPKFELNFGFIHYSFPDFGDDNTTEVFVSASAGVLLSPTLTVYQDVDEIKGGYWEAGLSHAVALSPGTNMELFGVAGLGSTGYIRGYFNIDPTNPIPAMPGLTGDTSLTDVRFGAAVPFSPIPFVTVTPSVAYSTLMGDASDAVDANGDDTSAFVWGLSAGFSF